MVHRLPLVLLLVALAVVVPSPARAQTSIEYEVLSLVNGVRSSAMPMHSGLEAVARGHSQDMAASGGLNHNGAAERNATAAPDPPESNGPPDDGFTGTWCENVAYVTGGSEGDVAQRIYDAWYNSPPHLECMQNTDMTTAGIGVYFDGQTWWATMDASQDRTPPGSSAPVVTQKPQTPAPPQSFTSAPPVAAPPTDTTPRSNRAQTDGAAGNAQISASNPTISPSVTPSLATVTVVARQAAGPLNSAPASRKNTLGWPEVLAATGILAVSLFSYTRFNRVRRSR